MPTLDFLKNEMIENYTTDDPMGMVREFGACVQIMIKYATTQEHLKIVRSLNDDYFRMTHRMLWKPGSVKPEELENLEDKYRSVATEIMGIKWD